MTDLTLSGSNAIQWLKNHDYGFSDDTRPRASARQFNNGGIYGVEIPVINNLDTLRKTIHILHNEGVYVSRFNETHGAFLLCDSEIQEMLALCREENYGMIFGLGPRPEYDRRAAFYRSPFGMEQARQLNNNDALRASVNDALRLAALGCRGLVVYDIGVLRILKLMRDESALPEDMIFKVSSHCMVSSPMLAQIHVENGADCLTTSHDVGLPVLQFMRKVSPGVSLDVPMDVYHDKGGFIRFHEVAEIVQVAAPVFLKVGASAQSNPYDKVGDATIVQRVSRVKRVLEMLAETLPDAARICSNDPLLGLPVAKAASVYYESTCNPMITMNINSQCKTRTQQLPLA